MNRKRILLGTLLFGFLLLAVSISLLIPFYGSESSASIELTDMENAASVMGVFNEASIIKNIHRPEDNGVIPVSPENDTSYDMVVTPNGNSYLFVPATIDGINMKEFTLYRAEPNGWQVVGKSPATGASHHTNLLFDEESNLYIVTCNGTAIQIHRYSNDGFSLLGLQEILSGGDDWCDSLHALIHDNKIRITATLTNDNPTEKNRELLFVDFSLKDRRFSTQISVDAGIEKLRQVIADKSGDLYLFSLHDMPYMSSQNAWNRGLYMSRFRNGVLMEKILLTDIKENPTSFYILPCEDNTYRVVLKLDTDQYRHLWLRDGKITHLEEISTKGSQIIFIDFFYQNALYGIGYHADCTETIIVRLSKDSCEVIESFPSSDMPFQHKNFNVAMLHTLSCLNTGTERVICLRFHIAPSLSEPVKFYFAQLIFKP